MRSVNIIFPRRIVVFRLVLYGVYEPASWGLYWCLNYTFSPEVAQPKVLFFSCFFLFFSFFFFVRSLLYLCFIVSYDISMKTRSVGNWNTKKQNDKYLNYVTNAPPCLHFRSKSFVLQSKWLPGQQKAISIVPYFRTWLGKKTN